jgi:hypothetical protein
MATAIPTMMMTAARAIPIALVDEIPPPPDELVVLVTTVGVGVEETVAPGAVTAPNGFALDVTTDPPPDPDPDPLPDPAGFVPE